MSRQPDREPIPPDRTYESVLHHFNVERGIARRLKAANREERKAIYRTMYDELFTQVPDHPRLTRRADPEQTRLSNEAKMELARHFVNRSSTVLEFGPGDCRFAFAMAGQVNTVYGVDIADQIGEDATPPGNFRLIVYNGYDLELPDDSIDTVTSQQLIEHLHPEDTADHFRLAWRILRPGGVYVFRTPHRFNGPRDVSRYFSDEPEGFHLKEWTIGELAALMKSIGYRTVKGYRPTRGFLLRLPMVYFHLMEAVLGRLPIYYRKRLARYFLPSITMAAFK